MLSVSSFVLLFDISTLPSVAVCGQSAVVWQFLPLSRVANVFEKSWLEFCEVMVG